MAKIINNEYVCIDCGMLIANGDYPEDMSDEDFENWLARVEADEKAYPGAYHMMGSPDMDKDFSTDPCDCCGTTLAGSRMHVKRAMSDENFDAWNED